MRMRIVFVALLCAVPMVLQAELIPPDVAYPVLPAEAKTPADFVPRGWTVEKQAEVDLDGDGRLDFMMVLLMAEKRNLVENPDGFGPDVLDTNPRMLVVGFQDQKHRYRLQVADHTLIPRHVNPVLDDPFVDAVAKNGALEVSLRFWASAGSWTTFQVSYTLRFESGCLRLIGYDYDETRRNTGKRSVISVNYLTGKVKESKGTLEDETLKEKWRSLKDARKVCLEHIGDGLEFRPEP